MPRAVPTDPGTTDGHTEDDRATGLETVIGSRVREYRTAAGMTAADLAGRTGVSRAMISRIEGATTSCSLTTLQRLAEGLAVPVTALFRGVDSNLEAVFTPSGHGARTIRSGSEHGHQYNTLGQLRGGEGLSLEPTLVTLTEKSLVFPLFQHAGQELIYMLDGAMVYGHGAFEYRLDPGDSLLFDGEGPHGPLQLVTLPIRFLAISQRAS
jgi:DNA-binding XRE family transcriptional regulator